MRLAPSGITPTALSFIPPAAGGTVLGTLTATDANTVDVFTWSLASGSMTMFSLTPTAAGARTAVVAVAMGQTLTSPTSITVNVKDSDSAAISATISIVSGARR